MEVLSIYADAMRERLAFPEPFLLTNRKSQQFQIINRFKNFESCLNRLYVCKNSSASGTQGLAVRFCRLQMCPAALARLNGRATFCT
jgi:hypothetical protein